MEKVYKIISNINQVIINPIIILAFGVALIVFLYGVLEFIWQARANPAKATQGRNHMFWGIIGMFIMISVFGLFKFLINTFPVSDAAKNDVNRVLKLD